MKCSFEYCNNVVSKQTEYRVRSGKFKNGYCCTDCSTYGRRQGLVHCAAHEKNGCQNLLQPKNGKFCSHSCAASFNNLGVRRNVGASKNSNHCLDCNTEIDKQATRCFRCSTNRKSKYFYIDENDITHVKPDIKLSDISTQKWGKGNYRSSKVRDTTRKFVARTLSESDKHCHTCGYEHFTEIAHIRPLADEPDDALLSDVVNWNNLLILCPNCHKEFDNELLSVTAIID